MNNNFSKFFAFVIVCISVSFVFTSCKSDVDTSAIDSLTKEKTQLLSSIDSLQAVYNTMAESTDTLTVTLEKANTTIAQKNDEIANLRKKASKADKASAAGQAALAAEVAQLKKAKIEYENVITAMRGEIAKLNKDKSKLMDDLDMSEGENEALKYEIDELKLLVRGMEAELDQRRIDGVKATNFRFEVLKNGNKPTASNNRAKTIVMDFDLNKIPSELQGTSNLYLVIKDAKTGVPIKSNNPVKASISPKGGKAFSLLAQEAKEITLNTDQRIQMRHDLQTRLAKGSYRAAVYSDLGLIGAVSFRLR